MDVPARVSFLSCLEPFRSISERELEGVAAALERIEFPAGTTICREGEAAPAAYVIVDGSVSLRISGVEFLRREASQWIGEAALLDPEARHSEAVALNDVVLLKIERVQFQQWMDQHASLLKGVARMFAVRQRLDTELQQDRTAKLQTLMNASKLINSSIQPDELIASILTVARRELNVERGTVYFVDHNKGLLRAKIASGLDASEIRLPIGQGVAGTVAATGETIILQDAYMDSRFDRSMDTRTGFQTRSVLCVPIKNQRGIVVGVLQLLNKIGAEFSSQDLSFLSALSDYVAIAMENAMVHLSLVEKERMEKELQLAREIQGHLLPVPPKGIPHTTLRARSVSCFEVGGDYYDFLPLTDGTLVLAIGDVSGKGVAAALIMSSLQAALRIAAPLVTDLPELVGHLNMLLHGMTKGLKYVTLFLARYDPSNGELRYVNCGHQPPLVMSASGVQQLDATGMPIGLIPGRKWKEQQTTIGAGDQMLLYTDGLTEASNPDDQQFGIPRLKDLAQQFRNQHGEEWIAKILEEVSVYEAGHPVEDDKTLVLLERS